MRPRYGFTADVNDLQTVSYGYDSLNHLSSAVTNNAWGVAFGYDGFGNLTHETVTQGTAPSLNVTYDANNHQNGQSYLRGARPSARQPSWGRRMCTSRGVRCGCRGMGIG